MEKVIHPEANHPKALKELMPEEEKEEFPAHQMTKEPDPQEVNKQA